MTAFGTVRVEERSRVRFPIHHDQDKARQSGPDGESECECAGKGDHRGVWIVGMRDERGNLEGVEKQQCEGKAKAQCGAHRGVDGELENDGWSQLCRMLAATH